MRARLLYQILTPRPDPELLNRRKAPGSERPVPSIGRRFRLKLR